MMFINVFLSYLHIFGYSLCCLKRSAPLYFSCQPCLATATQLSSPVEGHQRCSLKGEFVRFAQNFSLRHFLQNVKKQCVISKKSVYFVAEVSA